jgi:hypothetical protein
MLLVGRGDAIDNSCKMIMMEKPTVAADSGFVLRYVV